MLPGGRRLDGTCFGAMEVISFQGGDAPPVTGEVLDCSLV
jgi:hypothetical protein